MNRYVVGFATANQKKLAEAQAIASSYSQNRPVRIDVVALPPNVDVEERGDTFSANARIKLDAALAQGIPDNVDIVVAEDAGFEVDALQSITGKPFPGVHANRWLNDPALQQRLLGKILDKPTDEDRNRAILSALRNVADRSARYVTVLSVWNRATNAIGELKGTMELNVIGEDESPRGQFGFAYDTIVKSIGQDKTVAELTPAEKDAISHRGQALRSLFSTLA